MSKKCSRCGIDTPLNGFYKDPCRLGGLRSECKRCTGVDMANKYATNPRYHRIKSLMRAGMSIEEAEIGVRAVLSVAAVCEICGGSVRLSVDHHHGSGKFRGVLCARCNIMIGQAADSPSILRAGADYVERFSSAHK